MILRCILWLAILTFHAAAQPEVPPGITAVRLKDGVYRFDRPAGPSASFWLDMAKMFGWKPAQGLPFRRSIAFLAGVSRYASLQPNTLDFVENDVTRFRNFLLTSAGFDTVFEARNETVTRSLIENYMVNDFSIDGRILTSEDRLLFYYSGHGTARAQGFGYLQFSGARDGNFSGEHIVPVRDFQVWAQLNVARHLLVVLDSCASGLAIQAKSGGVDAVVRSLSGEGSGHLLTAGYGAQKVYGVDGKKGYSVLTRALMDALRNGTADRGNTGFMTISQVYGQIQVDVGNFAAAQGKKVSPQLGDLPRSFERSDGTFVFLNRNAKDPAIPDRRVLATVAKGDAASTDGTRFELVRLGFENLKANSDLTALNAFVKENRNVPGAATLVAIIEGRVRALESQPKGNERDGLDYVWIPPGKFVMGCSSEDKECESDETPHEVEITRGFWLGKTEVTQAAWTKVMGSNSSRFKGDQLPVENVSWEDASAYCAKIGMRLPTEAQWEYAARGGIAWASYSVLPAVAWHQGNSGAKTHLVGQMLANRFGLHDMLGNVREWVADWYAEYPGGRVVDPRGPANGSHKVQRGGSWTLSPRDVRASRRFRNVVSDRYSVIGFRCAGDVR